MNVKFSITTFATQNNTTKMNTTKTIQSALISVFDKTGLEPIVKALHNNNVTIFTERFNPRGFMSPIAEGAISLYKYQYLGTFYEDGKDVHSIKVIPRRAYEPCFSGIINICEGSWRIHSFDLILTKLVFWVFG